MTFISHCIYSNYLDCIEHIQSSQKHGRLLAELAVAVGLVAGADGDHGDVGGHVDGGGEDERAAGLGHNSTHLRKSQRSSQTSSRYPNLKMIGVLNSDSLNFFSITFLKLF